MFYRVFYVCYARTLDALRLTDIAFQMTFDARLHPHVRKRREFFAREVVVVHGLLSERQRVVGLALKDDLGRDHFVVSFHDPPGVAREPEELAGIGPVAFPHREMVISGIAQTVRRRPAGIVPLYRYVAAVYTCTRNTTAAY